MVFAYVISVLNFSLDVFQMTQLSSVSVHLQFDQLSKTNVLSSIRETYFVGCNTHLSSASTCITNLCNDNVIHHQIISYSIIVRDITRPCTFISIHYDLQT